MSFPRLTKIAQGDIPDSPHLSAGFEIRIEPKTRDRIEALAQKGRDPGDTIRRAIDNGLGKLEAELDATTLKELPFRPAK